MIFKELSTIKKEELSNQLTTYAQSVGGNNYFLTMIENIKEANPNPLLNKTAIFHYKYGTLNWEKSIYKDTLGELFNAMRREEQTGDILDGLTPKQYKKSMNMLKILKPITITVNPKDDTLDGFSFSILDTTQLKKTKISLIFKIIFFYGVDFSKEVLNYKKLDNTN